MTETQERDMVAELLIPEIGELLAAGKAEEVAAALAELRDPEVADVLSELDHDQRARAFEVLPVDRAADIFDFLEQHQQEAIVEHVHDDHLATVFNEMDVDDRVEFLEDAPDEVVDATLALMKPEQRQQTERVLEYPEESVGRLITTEYLTLRPEWTVRQSLDHLREHGEQAETLHTLYVVDDHDRLIDHIRLRRLVLASAGQTCEELREGQVVSLNAEEDREEAVRVMERYDLPVLPVVDRDGVLLGIVTFDDVAEVAEEEITEDMHKMGGLEALTTPYISTSIAELVRKRGVWLMLLFVGGLLTVFAMSYFHDQLEEMAILALFVPLIIASGGNSGSQAATLIIRSLAIGEVRTSDWLRVLRREMVSGLVLGSLLGVLGLIVASLVTFFMPGGGVWPHAVHVGFAIGTAVVGVILVGVTVGSMLPIALESLGLDPAAVSTPFVATIVDVTGLVIYFLVAMTILLGVYPSLALDLYAASVENLLDGMASAKEAAAASGLAEIAANAAQEH